MWLATHTVNILTGVDTEDEYGDSLDAATVAAGNVAVSIRERSQRVFRYDSQTPRVIRFLTGRAPAGTPVQAGDRLADVNSAPVWVVDQVAHPGNPVHDPGLVLDLRVI